ncbi:unnamed protein product [Ostreobium quekettii]|uniref:Cyclin N-terminal domain-containing protein n=1 Tax=Ostreobium quekettii TaxID=121088 RepID=A0A8S1IKI8_9CHLO|nr:unnamed protein product [Ostreobium quekettii]
MVVPYFQECLLMRAAAQVLNLPLECTSTALTFAHKFYAAAPQAASREDLVPAACLFCAAKVEEAPLRTTDLLNALAYLKGASGRHPTVRAAMPWLPALPAEPCPWLVGRRYYDAKLCLLHAEQLILRHMHFQVVGSHPHKFLLSFCAAMGASDRVAALGVALLNDCMVYTDLVARLTPEQVAGGALHLALEWAEESSGGRSLRWLREIGLDDASVEAVGHCLLDMVVEVRSREGQLEATNRGVEVD